MILASGVYAESFLSQLREFFDATNGTNWNRNEGWTDGNNEDYCNWFGITCPLYTENVSHIDLPNNGLKGTIPSSIVTISTLKHMDLSNNAITGTIPSSMASLSDLMTLYLGNNQVSGTIPSDLMNLTVDYPTLQDVQLQYNRLEGTIPDALFGPANLPIFHPKVPLQKLNLEYNAITGSIPDRIVRSESMTTLLLAGNHMKGNVSERVDEFLQILKYCDLTDQQFNFSEAVSEKCLH